MKAHMELVITKDDDGGEVRLGVKSCTPILDLSDTVSQDELLRKCEDIMNTCGMGSLLYLEHWLTHQPQIV